MIDNARGCPGIKNAIFFVSAFLILSSIWGLSFFVLPTVELLLFSPFIIIACVRIQNPIRASDIKSAILLFCTLVVLGYPVSAFISHSRTTGWLRYATMPSHYYLPYLMNYFLSLAAIDSAIALALKGKLMRAGATSGTVFRSVRFCCCLLVPALIVYAGALNNSRLLIKELSIVLPKKSSTLSGLKIAFASDFHLVRSWNDRFLDGFIPRINALRPDIILIGGDMVDRHGDEIPGRFETQFRGLRAKYGVFAVQGNHDLITGGRPSHFFAQSGMRLLDDCVEKIDDAFYVAGREYKGMPRKPIGELLKDAPDDLPVILLDHHSADTDNVGRSRVNLHLSGHTHSGGVKAKGNALFVISCGVQAYGAPVKMPGHSEILFIKVTFQSNAGTPKLLEPAGYDSSLFGCGL